MSMKRFSFPALVICLALACTAKNTHPIRLGTFSELRESSVQLIRIHSPWEPEEYLSINFPEHCWGTNLPNVGHGRTAPTASPWRFNDDQTQASFTRSTRPGVTFRAAAVVDSMAVRLTIELKNDSDLPISDVRTLVCVRPDHMTAFRDTSFAHTSVAVDGEEARLGIDTHFHGNLPERGPVNWALNLVGGLDNETLPDISWFRGGEGGGPGRVVEERADPPLIAIHSKTDPKRWLAVIWKPARILFSNPGIPCIHSDPLPPDCPAGGSSRAEGVILFHRGSFDTLVERAKLSLGY